MATIPFRASLFCSLALAVGCSNKAPQTVEKVAVEEKKAPQAVEKVEAVEEKSKPQAPVIEDDFKILDVVLVDLLDFKDFMSSTKIILDPMTAGGPGIASQGAQYNHEVNFDNGRTVSVELQYDQRRRNPNKPIPLAGYKSPNPKILVEKLISEKTYSSFSFETGEYVTHTLSEEDADKFRFRMLWHRDGSGYVIALLPGYSKDGNTAIFEAYCGPSAHGATLIYKLAKKDGKWTVVWRVKNRYL